MIMSPLNFTIPVMESGGRFCLVLRIIDDLLVEELEQFELYFQNLPSDFATVGDPATLCITINSEDDEGIYIQHLGYNCDGYIVIS